MSFYHDIITQAFRHDINYKRIKRFILSAVCLTEISGINLRAADSTELLIRAQDDNTLGGLKVKLTIPLKLEEGPRGAGIEVVTEDNKRALLDQDRNFLRYTNVDLEGNRLPGLVIHNNISIYRGSTSKSNTAKFKVLVSGREKYEVLKLYDSENQHPAYYARYQDYYYLITPEILNSSIYNPIVIYPTLKDTPFSRTPSRMEGIAIEKMPFFDSVSIFGAVWYVFDMYTKDINEIGDFVLKKRWNGRSVTKIYPSMTEEKYNLLLKKRLGADYNYFLGNAFYLPVDGFHLLCFFPFSKGGIETTGQSSDIVMHEAGHNVLYILRPDLREKRSTFYDVAAFDESFGDLTAFFALASIKEIVTRIIAVTKGNVETSSFFSVLGETISNRRDATEKTNLSQKPSCEEHEYSERFTRSIYGTLADTFNLRKRLNNPQFASDEEVLLINTAKSLRKLFLKSIINITVEDFNFASFGRMLEKTAFDNQETSFFTGFIFHNFTKQGIDLNNKIWSPICIPGAMSKAKSYQGKSICSSSFKSKKDTVKSFRGLSITESSYYDTSSDEYSSDSY